MKIDSILAAIPSRSGSIRVEIGGALLAWASDPTPPAPCGGLAFKEGVSSAHVARDIIAAGFLESPHSHVLWLDDDMAPDYQAHIRPLLLRAAELSSDFFSAAYCIRQPGKILQAEPVEGQSVNSGGVCEMKYVGFGCVLISRRVFSAVAASCRAYVKGEGVGQRSLIGFFHPSEPGEYDDVAFCRRARAAGFKLQMDPRILVPHVGTAAFPLHVHR